MSARRVFLLRLETKRGDDAIRGLRWLLRVLLRRFQIRCIECREEERP
jgi:hypothetical protein